MLSEDQQKAVDGIRAWIASSPSGHVASLAGFAGCGKTYVISMLAKEWQAAGMRVLFVSPTGKASLVLRQQMKAAGVDADVMTIHKAIYEPPVENEGSLHWTLHGRTVSATVVVIDEASMVDAELWGDLQAACDGAAFLAVGDHGQLPPVRESANLLTDPTWRLETIHRQAAGNPVIEFGRLIREVSVPAALAFARASTDPRLQVRRLKTRQDNEDAVRWAYSTPDPQDGMIITGTNAERCTVNRVARRAFGFDGAGPEPRDLAIVLRNHHASGMMNGERALLTYVTPAGGGYIRTNLTHHTSPLDQFGAERAMGMKQAPRSCLLLDYGYALTCHKAQGSQAARVVVSLSSIGWLKEDLPRWLYTASTRAQDSLLLVS
jgi:exodeoxyribonuclease-5